jgi:HTH-type transcriptional regulator/antitoxin HigA
MTALAIDYIVKITQHKLLLPLVVFKKPTSDKESKYLEGILDQLVD